VNKEKKAWKQPNYNTCWHFATKVTGAWSLHKSMVYDDWQSLYAVYQL